VQPATVGPDLQAGVAALQALPGVNGRVAAVGYCMGGRLAFALAATGVLDRAVCYYGGGIATQLGLAPQIHCPVMFHHAGVDAAIPQEAVAQVQAAMAASPAAAVSTFFDYPGAQHGFNCWARAAWHPAASAQALGRTLGFLAQMY
jgi:carboxymethylenebutenolidase